MAHFAKLGVGNKVLQVVVLSNDAILDEDGEENEQIGVDYLNNLYEIYDHILVLRNNFLPSCFLGI